MDYVLEWNRKVRRKKLLKGTIRQNSRLFSPTLLESEMTYKVSCPTGGTSEISNCKKCGWFGDPDGKIIPEYVICNYLITIGLRSLFGADN